MSGIPNFVKRLGIMTTSVTGGIISSKIFGSDLFYSKFKDKDNLKQSDYELYKYYRHREWVSNCDRGFFASGFIYGGIMAVLPLFRPIVYVASFTALMGNTLATTTDIREDDDDGGYGGYCTLDDDSDMYRDDEDD